jgi:hypothetical protein
LELEAKLPDDMQYTLEWLQKFFYTQ